MKFKNMENLSPRLENFINNEFNVEGIYYDGEWDEEGHNWESIFIETTKFFGNFVKDFNEKNFNCVLSSGKPIFVCEVKKDDNDNIIILNNHNDKTKIEELKKYAETTFNDLVDILDKKNLKNDFMKFLGLNETEFENFREKFGNHYIIEMNSNRLTLAKDVNIEYDYSIMFSIRNNGLSIVESNIPTRELVKDLGADLTKKLIKNAFQDFCCLKKEDMNDKYGIVDNFLNYVVKNNYEVKQNILECHECSDNFENPVELFPKYKKIQLPEKEKYSKYYYNIQILDENGEEKSRIKIYHYKNNENGAMIFYGDYNGEFKGFCEDRKMRPFLNYMKEQYQTRLQEELNRVNNKNNIEYNKPMDKSKTYKLENGLNVTLKYNDQKAIYTDENGEEHTGRFKMVSPDSFNFEYIFTSDDNKMEIYFHNNEIKDYIKKICIKDDISGKKVVKKYRKNKNQEIELEYKGTYDDFGRRYNGFGKEYDPYYPDKLIFEGKYINGRKNGIFYDNNKNIENIFFNLNSTKNKNNFNYEPIKNYNNNYNNYNNNNLLSLANNLEKEINNQERTCSNDLLRYTKNINVNKKQERSRFFLYFGKSSIGSTKFSKSSLHS